MSCHGTVPPTISEDGASPRNVSIISGRSLVITCPAAGAPAPQITWFKDNAQVVPGDSPDVRVLSNGRRLEMSAVSVDDAGRYRCLAENVAGRVDRQYQLHVFGLYSSYDTVKPHHFYSEYSSILNDAQGRGYATIAVCLSYNYGLFRRFC